jgi:hypothetical protein
MVVSYVLRNAMLLRVSYAHLEVIIHSLKMACSRSPQFDVQVLEMLICRSLSIECTAYWHFAMAVKRKEKASLHSLPWRSNSCPKKENNNQEIDPVMTSLPS